MKADIFQILSPDFILNQSLSCVRTAAFMVWSYQASYVILNTCVSALQSARVCAQAAGSAGAAAGFCGVCSALLRREESTRGCVH